LYLRIDTQMMLQRCLLMRISVCEHDITVLTHSITLSVYEDHWERVSIFTIRRRMWRGWWRCWKKLVSSFYYGFNIFLVNSSSFLYEK
jgi:hypothetical protein